MYLACLRAGFIYLPLNNTYTNDELNFFFGDAQPKVIICDAKNEQAISKIKNSANSCIKILNADGKGTLLESSAEHGTSEEVHPVAPDDTAVILYTSGTTGKPKGAMITAYEYQRPFKNLGHYSRRHYFTYATAVSCSWTFFRSKYRAAFWCNHHCIT